MTDEDTTTQKLWRDLTPEEKGALLLAYHEGKPLEMAHRFYMGWQDAPAKGLKWDDLVHYRIRPPEPERRTRLLYVAHDCPPYLKEIGDIDMVDGIPDAASVKIITPQTEC
jgi:hypothetical protein